MKCFVSNENCSDQFSEGRRAHKRDELQRYFKKIDSRILEIFRDILVRENWKYFENLRTLIETPNVTIFDKQWGFQSIFNFHMAMQVFNRNNSKIFSNGIKNWSYLHSKTNKAIRYLVIATLLAKAVR